MVFGVPIFLPEKIDVKTLKNWEGDILYSPHGLLGEILSSNMLLMQFQQALVDLSQGVTEQNKGWKYVPGGY